MDETTQRIKLIMEYYSMNALEFSEKIRICEVRLEQILKGKKVASLKVMPHYYKSNKTSTVRIHTHRMT